MLYSKPPMPTAEKSYPTILIDGDHDAGRGLNWAELWRYRELLYFLTWRDIALRYKQTALGGLWALIYPLLSVGVFTIFFGRIAKLPSDGIPYSLFSFSGLLIWIYFANTISRCNSSLVGNAHMLNKVYFPRLLLPLSSIFPGLVDFAIASTVLALGCLYYGILPNWTAVFAPAVLLGTGGFSLGLGMALGALNVRYRDINNGIAFLLQMWMFATPIVYPASLVSEKYRWVVGLNPMVGYVEAFRWSLFGTQLDTRLVTMSVVTTLICLVFGVRYFTKVEKTFADVI